MKRVNNVNHHLESLTILIPGIMMIYISFWLVVQLIILKG